MENSIKEDIKIVENYLANSAMNEIDSNFFKNSGWETVDLEIPKSMQHILSDYKRVLKENEELLQEKINNQKIIALAQNDMLNYQAGFEDGKNGRTSAVQSIIENQQYYIFQKQIEKYERHIEKLQKENEEWQKAYQEEKDKQFKLIQNTNNTIKTANIAIKDLQEKLKKVIPVQKVKDIIERIDYDIKKTKEIISNNSNIYTSNRKNDYQIVRLRAMNTKSLDIKKRLQELLEGRK